MKSIVVDVDLTIVDTLTPWVTWWEEQTGQSFPWDKIGPELSFNEALGVHMSRDNSMIYWNQSDLYDDLMPLDGSVKVLELLSHAYEIYFVSHCQKGHYDSKLRFLNKYFPFHSGLINTQNKYAIEADIYFDDHVDYTQKIVDKRPHADVYQFVTADNEYQLVDGATPMYSWRDFNELHFNRG